jgi:hypothetical protein
MKLRKKDVQTANKIEKYKNLIEIEEEFQRLNQLKLFIFSKKVNI